MVNLDLVRGNIESGGVSGRIMVLTTLLHKLEIKFHFIIERQYEYERMNGGDDRRSNMQLQNNYMRVF